MEFQLDNSKSVELQLSNDAFFYLLQEDEMLDDSNMEEANEVMSMFPNGFIIQDNWEYIDDDLINAIFIPYIKQKSFDGKVELFNNWIFQYKVLNKYKAFCRFYNTVTGKTFNEGEWPIIECCNGKKHRIHIQKQGRRDFCEMPLD